MEPKATLPPVTTLPVAKSLSIFLSSEYHQGFFLASMWFLMMSDIHILCISHHLDLLCLRSCNGWNKICFCDSILNRVLCCNWGIHSSVLRRKIQILLCCRLEVAKFYFLCFCAAALVFRFLACLLVWLACLLLGFWGFLASLFVLVVRFLIIFLLIHLKKYKKRNKICYFLEYHAFISVGLVS